MRTSPAINRALGFLEEVSLSEPPVAGPPALDRLCYALFFGARRLHISENTLDICGSFSHSDRQALARLLATSSEVFEHVSGSLGIEALHRAEAGASRFLVLVEQVPAVYPLKRGKRLLTDAVACYLFGLDKASIAMCRGAVEVLVGELSPDQGSTHLGQAIRSLRDTGKISRQQATDMWFISDQADEPLLEEPTHDALDASECLKRLAGLLATHPRGGSA